MKTTPAFKIDECDWEELDADSFEDLVFKFDSQEIIDTLGDVYDGDEITLMLTGNLLEGDGGTAVEGTDCVIIRNNGK